MAEPTMPLCPAIKILEFLLITTENTEAKRALKTENGKMKKGDRDYLPPRTPKTPRWLSRKLKV
jgi:hypothetical protein